jgi:hypothetical protein
MLRRQRSIDKLIKALLSKRSIVARWMEESAPKLSAGLTLLSFAIQTFRARSLTLFAAISLSLLLTSSLVLLCESPFGNRLLIRQCHVLIRAILLPVSLHQVVIAELELLL